jgi:pimeloyl-ACP methyl ester carboxylesterase
MRAQKIIHADYVLEYFLFGSGPESMLAFHGFNNNARDFESLGKISGDRYTIVSVNIFFHGNSTVHERLIDDGMSKPELKSLFAEVFKIRAADKFTLLGYSLGGRIALKMLELFPERIEKIILLAPDGIKINPFYSFLTRTWIGKKLLRNTVANPVFFTRLAGFLKTTRIISEKRYNFAYSNFENRSKREKVYQVWMTLKNVVSKQGDIRRKLVRYNIRMYLFFGKYDKIIPPSIGEKFRKGVERQVKLHILEEGHRLIRQDVLEKVMILTENDE